MNNKLLKFCVNNNKEDAKYILKKQLVVPGENFKALKEACRLGYIEIVQMLLNYGEDPSKENNYCVHLACGYGNKELLDILSEDPRTDIKCINGVSLIISVNHGHLPIVKRLMDKEVPFENSLLTIAIEKQYCDVVEYLLNFIEPEENHFAICTNDDVYKLMLRHFVKLHNVVKLQKFCKLHLAF